MKLRPHALLALSVGAAGHFHADVAYLQRLNLTDRAGLAAARAPAPAPRPTVAPARRVWVLFADGLRRDTAREVPALQAIAREGVERPLLADFPSFTFPAITSMATGRPPRASGVRMNKPGPYPVWDSVNRRAAAAGIRVVAAADDFPEWAELLQLPASGVVAGAHDFLVDPARDDGHRELAWIYFGAIDEAGHVFGADSPEYQLAARELGALAARLWADLDPRWDALVIVSDHGHLARGGHGGTEPEVLEGMMIAAGGPFPRRAAPAAGARQLASTLALALGVPAPADAIGAPMLDLFGGPPVEVATDAPIEASFARDAAVRTAIAALVLGVLMFLFHRVGVRVTARDAVPPLVYAATFSIPYAIAGYGLSWSVPRGQPGFLLETAIFAALALVASLLAADRARRREEALSVALVFGVPYVLVSAWVGLDTRALAGPVASWLVILLGTIEFYAGLAYGVRACFAPRAQATGAAGAGTADALHGLRRSPTP